MFSTCLGPEGQAKEVCERRGHLEDFAEKERISILGKFPWKQSVGQIGMERHTEP